MQDHICPHCGKKLEGHPTDFGWALPDEVWAMPETEREKKAKFTRDLCQYGDRYFIKCIIAIPFTYQKDIFAWGAWVEVDCPIFQKYLEIYEKDAFNEPRVSGRLANQPPGYEHLIDEEVEIQFGHSSKRPNVWFSEKSNLLIAKEQRSGIDINRYHELLKNIENVTKKKT